MRTLVLVPTVRGTWPAWASCSRAQVTRTLHVHEAKHPGPPPILAANPRFLVRLSPLSCQFPAQCTSHPAPAATRPGQKRPSREIPCSRKIQPPAAPRQSPSKPPTGARRPVTAVPTANLSAGSSPPEAWGLGQSRVVWRTLPTLFSRLSNPQPYSCTHTRTHTLLGLSLIFSHTHTRNARLAFATKPPPLIPPYWSLCVVAASRDRKRGFQPRLVSLCLTFLDFLFFFSLLPFHCDTSQGRKGVAKIADSHWLDTTPDCMAMDQLNGGECISKSEKGESREAGPCLFLHHQPSIASQPTERRIVARLIC